MDTVYNKLTFNTLILLGGWQEGRPPCKKILHRQYPKFFFL